MKVYKNSTTTKELDNVRTKKLEKLLGEAVTGLDLGIDFHSINISELDFERYDGFIPHAHNRGGIDLIAITTIGSLVGSGEHIGTKAETYAEESYNDDWNQIVKDNPELNQEIESDLEQLYNLQGDSLYDDYNGLAFRIRIMYEGDGEMCVHSGWDEDAPYFRWKCNTDLVQEIKFKTKKELRVKLKKAIAKAIKGM